MRFVRFSREALTQGVVNTRIDGVPVRIYSTAKTVADCFKCRKTIGPEVTILALRESIRQNKCSRERLRHFAKICHVDKLASRWYKMLPPH
jgi:predicted transcriptional regulator of viral defense system